MRYHTSHVKKEVWDLSLLDRVWEIVLNGMEEDSYGSMSEPPFIHIDLTLAGTDMDDEDIRACILYINSDGSKEVQDFPDDASAREMFDGMVNEIEGGLQSEFDRANLPSVD